MSTQYRRHFQVTPLLLWAILLSLYPEDSLAEDASGLLFHASFERQALADQAGGDGTPLGNQGLQIVAGGRKSRALFLDWGAHLSFSARGNIYPERGTVFFWWQLDEPPGETPFSIIRISTHRLHSPEHGFAHLFWTGKTFRLRLFDRDSRVLQVDADRSAPVVAGRWFSLAFSWHELEGLRFYIDGQEVGNHLGRFHFGRWLDQIGIHTQLLTPYHRQGNERRALVDELRIFSEALSQSTIRNLSQLGAGWQGQQTLANGTHSDSWPDHWADRFGWNKIGDIPQTDAPISFRTVRIPSARDVKRSSLAAVDGSPESSWPQTIKAYKHEGRLLRLDALDEPFNYLSLQGNLQGKIYAGEASNNRLLWDLSSEGNRETTKQLSAPVNAPSIQVERQTGQLRELSLFLVRDGPFPITDTARESSTIYRLMPPERAADLPAQSARQVRSLFGQRPELRMRYLPQDREAWIAVPEESYQPPATQTESHRNLHYRHIFLPPFLSHTVVSTIEIRMGKARNLPPLDSTVRWTVKDPVLPERDLIHVDFRLSRGQPARILLDLADAIVPAGQALWMTVASDQVEFAQNYFDHAEIEVRTSTPIRLPRKQTSRHDWLADRFLRIRAGLRELTQSLDWMLMDFLSARRQFSKVDALSRLVDDVLQTRPQDRLALSYKGVLQRDTAPPEFREEKTQSQTNPQWAVQQMRLVEHFKHIAQWWINNRQVEAGEFGGGLERDTQLVTHWPGIALMDGPARHLRDSLVSLLEACLHRGSLENGLNREIASARQAYRAGLNLAPMLALLDYGNPRWIEMLMQTSRHLDRLTATNQAGHRHFHSFLFSATDSIREGYYAQEGIFGPLLWHAALTLAGYNRSPMVVQWLKEYADGRLAHWKRDRHPRLSQAIHFPSDKAMSWGLPDLPMLDLMWGVFRMTDDPAYLWPLSRLVQAGHVERAQLTSGRWQSFLKEGTESNPFLNLLPKLNVWNHHLHYREAGLLARQFAYEATGRKRYLLDYQAALLKHLEQNRILYTEAELSPSGVFIPHRATQRARLGGIAQATHQIQAGHAVSWENTSGQVSALVSAAKPDALEVAAFNLGETLHDVRLRLWQLENGTYEVTEGIDVNDDGQTDLLINRRTLKLKRHSSIPLTLRGGKSTIIKVKQLHKGTPLWQLPDLAVGPEDFQYDLSSDRGKVTIHNIGSTASHPFRLRIQDSREAVLFERELASLPAPLDLHPKTTVVPLSGLRAAGAESLYLRLVPGPEIEEITSHNNGLKVTLSR